MGMGTTNVEGRIAASIGGMGPEAPKFEESLDLPNGGVLFALPALMACGLLHYVEQYFHLKQGFYSLETILLSVAFMALSRIKSVEQLRYQAPGEWGKILGQDRLPGVKCLREKITELSKDKPMEWSADLSKKWLYEDPEDSTVLYVDGHVRVYHGHQTQLPRHHVSRQKLCLRATTDYWVCGMDGQPFLKVNKAIDPGMIKTIENDILPWVKDQISNQITKKKLEEDPLIHSFTIVGDREMYSPSFMWRLKRQRIACQTYNKFPKDDWDKQEFRRHTIELINGTKEEVMLAERGTFLAVKKNDMKELPEDKILPLGSLVKAEESTYRCGIWVREIRKLNNSGKQTAILSTVYCEEQITRLASSMFARWCQENYFRYARQHYSLDRLVNYKLEEIPEEEVVNPLYRDLEGKIRKTAALLSRRKVKFSSIHLKQDIEEKYVAKYKHEKNILTEEMDQFAKELVELKLKKKGTPKRLKIKDLPPEAQFQQLSNQSKHLVDTIKVIAYRAETAMADIIKERMSRKCDARNTLVAIYKNEIDLIPDIEAKTLTVRLHHLAEHGTARAIQYLCEELTLTETLFPGTDLRLIYELVSFAKPSSDGS